VLLFRLQRRLTLQITEIVSMPQLRSSSASHLGQSPSDCTGLLRPEVKWEVFLVLVVLPQILAGLVVHHSQDSCDRLAHNITVNRVLGLDRAQKHDRDVHLGEF